MLAELPLDTGTDINVRRGATGAGATGALGVEYPWFAQFDNCSWDAPLLNVKAPLSISSQTELDTAYSPVAFKSADAPGFDPAQAHVPLGPMD